MLTVGGTSDQGQVRAINEDAFAAVLDAQVYIVADGVGGNNAGEVASKTAIRSVVEEVEMHPFTDHGDEAAIRRYFSHCLDLANDSVNAMGKDQPENSGLATTMVICYIEEDTAYFVNVGDSRGYLYRDGELLRITEDHSYVHTLVRMGVLTEEEARHHKRGNVITRAVGAEETVTGDLFPVELAEDDLILLCTDGLYGELSEEEIATLLGEGEDIQQLSEDLVQAANSAGGRDNITAVIIRYQEGEANE